MKPPARFATDSTLPARLTVDLNSVAQARFPYDQERGLLAFQDALSQLDASGSEHMPDLAPIGRSPISSSLIASSTIKLVKLVLISALGLTVWATRNEWRAVEPQPAAVQAVAELPATPDPVEAPSAAVVEEVVPTAVTPPAKPPLPRFAQATESSRARQEIAQLNEAKRALPADPAAALRLARQSSREFPQGLLREEREALIVLALWQLGEIGAARAGAEQFISRYPRSSYRARMQEYIAR